MPLLKCQINGKLGWKFGATGKCFTGSQGRSKAVKQGRAIQASKNRGDALEDAVTRIRRRQAQNIQKPKRKPPARLPVWLFPLPAEKRYEILLVEYVDSLGEIIDKMIVPHLQSLVDERNLVVPELSKTDDFADSIDRLTKSVTLEFAANPFDKKRQVDITGNQTNVWNEKEWEKQMRAAFGVNIFQREPFINSSLNSFAIENVSLITKMETEYLSTVEGIVQRGVRQGQSSATIAKDLKKRLDVTKSRARLIARDQVSKLNGQLTELRQTNLGIEKYIWRTAQDERVRPTHRAHNGKKFDWDNPPSNTGHPGEDIQCRCYAEPDFDNVAKELGISKAVFREPPSRTKKVLTTVAALAAAKAGEIAIRKLARKSTIGTLLLPPPVKKPKIHITAQTLLLQLITLSAKINTSTQTSPSIKIPSTNELTELITTATVLKKEIQK